MRSIAASVLVGVDPSTAFMAFTEEMELGGGYVALSITSTRPARSGCDGEPGVGGRIVEVYD